LATWSLTQTMYSPPLAMRQKSWIDGAVDATGRLTGATTLHGL
jgi:hypothetical protein